MSVQIFFMIFLLGVVQQKNNPKIVKLFYTDVENECFDFHQISCNCLEHKAFLGITS